MDDMVSSEQRQTMKKCFFLTFSYLFPHPQHRVSRLKRNYYWTAIPDTPFTLVLTIPEPYGLNRLQIRYEDEIHRIHAKGNDVLSFFEGRRWRVHPDW